MILKLFVIKTNKIICASNGETKDLIITQKYIIKYDNNNIKNLKIIKTYKYMNDDLFKNFEEVYNNTLSNDESLKNSGLSYSGSILKDTYKIELNINVSKISTKDFENLGFNKDLYSMKTALENQGLKCN